MKTYNYHEAIKNDVMTYINTMYDAEEIRKLTTYGNEEELATFKEKLNDELWIEDTVTGNASGSYTLSRYTAEEHLCHNTDLMFDALEEMGYITTSRFEPETIDVIIRCYLLSSAIERAIEDIAERITNQKFENTESEVM